MPRNFVNNRDIIQLRNSASAITVTTADAAKNNARITNSKGGLALVTVHALDISSGDEVYVITIEGRDTVGAGGYTVLGTVTVSAVLASVAGTYMASLDTIKKEMRANATLSGTTPSLTYSAHVIGESAQYMPGAGAAITA